MCSENGTILLVIRFSVWADDPEESVVLTPLRLLTQIFLCIKKRLLGAGTVFIGHGVVVFLLSDPSLF